MSYWPSNKVVILGVYVYMHIVGTKFLSYNCANILNSEIIVFITSMLKPSFRRLSSRLCTLHGIN